MIGKIPRQQGGVHALQYCQHLHYSDQAVGQSRRRIKLLAVISETQSFSNSPSFFDIPIIDDPAQRLDHFEIASYSPPPSGYIQLVVAGAGPAGLAIAARVSHAGFKVCVVDPDPLGAWPNNYGVWVDEFEAMGHSDCLANVWSKANVWLGEEQDKERKLYRPYARVDRFKLKSKLLSQCVDQGVEFHIGKVEGTKQEEGLVRVQCTGGLEVVTAVVVDATGHARKLVDFDQQFDPGYQGAYGVTLDVKAHPFDLDTMLFMDWRDTHTHDKPEMFKRNQRTPTFLYAMPFSPTKVFVEETSLVARPAVGFPELKERLYARLKHMGIEVNSASEEEYCLIPMGGVLPVIPQRVVGIGGTAGMVHPSTGYMVARALAAVPALGDAIVEQLSKPGDQANATSSPLCARSEAEAVEISEQLWKSVWPGWRLRQREFFTFGMDVLLTLDLNQTRDFFTAFFQLSDFHWQGFLSARLTLPQLVGFGWALFFQSTPSARLNLMAQGLPGLLMLLSRLPATAAK